MYNEIDLHQMNFDDALRVFITKYNSLYKKGERREIMVIHGYGSKFLDSTPVIRTKIREYFLRNKECVKMRLDMKSRSYLCYAIKTPTITKEKEKIIL